jgi:hypothetical protein
MNSTEPTTPAEWADRAAEAVRGLNHASRGGYAWPSDVDAVVGSLETLAQRMPQALGQASRWLARETEAGRVGHDSGADTAYAVGRALANLEAAADLAGELRALLAEARADTTHLTGIER